MQACVESYLLNSHECGRPNTLRCATQQTSCSTELHAVRGAHDRHGGAPGRAVRAGPLQFAAATCLAAIATTVGIPLEQVASVCPRSGHHLKCARRSALLGPL
jgi:hypothetical protein